MTKRYLSLLLALLPAEPLAGCLSLGGKPPKVLLTINSTASLPVGSTQNSANAKTVTIQVPVVPQSLAVARVPVQTGDRALCHRRRQ